MGGRGAYYRAKYGGRGRREQDDHVGESYTHQGDAYDSDSCSHQQGPVARSTSISSLTAFFNTYNGRGYGQLKDLTGRSFHLGTAGSTISFLRVQPDPYAPGSQISVRVPWDSVLAADALQPRGLPEGLPALHEWGLRCLAAEDFIARRLVHGLKREGCAALQCAQVSPHVIPRSTVRTDTSGGEGNPSQYFTITLRVKLPGNGRRIDGPGALSILADHLRSVVEEDLMCLHRETLVAHIHSVLDQEWLRGRLGPKGLVAFVCDGAVLPRAAGDSDAPLDSRRAVPFVSPPTLARRFTLPYTKAEVTGMGLPRGLTLIAGGGFHGKSTLLRALELGVYNHTPADGRAFVVTEPTAVKIRAEDRRSVHGVDISAFIRGLPRGVDTTAFTTQDASGSTSQAANIVEALELGCRALLLDEDTSATNFMYRDSLMERLVPREREPITPFVERVGELRRTRDVSTIIVVGGSGQYFPLATTVVVMNAYVAEDATASVRDIVSSAGEGAFLSLGGSDGSRDSGAFRHPVDRAVDHSGTFSSIQRAPGRCYTKISGVGLERIRIGADEIDLSLVEQLVEEGQVNAIVQVLALLFDGSAEVTNNVQDGSFSCRPPVSPPSLTPGDGAPANASAFCILVRNCERLLRQRELEVQTQSTYVPRGFTSLPRVFEIGAGLNRLRTLCTRSMKR